jgi:hypothetical protein
MERQIVSGPGLPKQIGPYSQAVRAGGFVFVSGHGALVAFGKAVGSTHDAVIHVPQPSALTSATPSHWVPAVVELRRNSDSESLSQRTPAIAPDVSRSERRRARPRQALST